MSEEPEVTIHYDEGRAGVHDAGFFLGVIRRLHGEMEAQRDKRRAAIVCYEIGRLFEDHLGDLFQASSHYQEALTKFPNFLPALRALRRISFVRGNWAQFVSMADLELRIARDDKARAQLWFEKAEVQHAQLGSLGEAIASLDKCLELDPHNVKALWLLDALLRETRDYEGLVGRLAELAGRVTSEYLAIQLLYEAGRACEVHRLDADAAIGFYEKVVEKDPDNAQGLTALSRLYYQKKRYRPLIDILRRRAGRSVGRQKARVLYSAARILHERLSEVEEAIRTLEEAHAEDPESGLVLGELVMLCQYAGVHDRLARYYEEQIHAAADGKERAAIRLRLGLLYEERLGDDDKAELCYQKAIEEDPQYQPSFVQLALFYQKRGRADRIISMHVKEAVATESPMRRAMAYHRAAELLEAQEKLEDAIDYYHKATTTVPSFVPSFNAMERLLEKTGNYGRLVNVYRERLEGEENVNVRIALLEKTGRVMEEQLLNKQAAASVFRELLELDPRNAAAIAAMTRITAEQGEWEEHVGYLLREAERLTDDEHVVDILQRVGEIYEHHLGSEEKAIETYRKLLSVSPFYPHAIRNLGRIYNRRGMTAELIELNRAELGAATDPEERSMLLYRIGTLVETQLKDTAQALPVYRSALLEYPRNMAASWALYRLYRAQGDWMSIIEILEGEAAGIPEGHQRALALVRIGEIWEEILGRADMAYDSYSQALRMEAGLSEARASLVRLCEDEGNYEYLAELLFQEYQTSVDKDDQYRIAYSLGELWLDRLNNPKQAADWFMKALTAQPLALAPLRALENVFRLGGDWKSLAEILRKLVRSIPDGLSRFVFLHELEMIELRLGMKPGPGADEKEAAALVPHDAPELLDVYDVVMDRLVKGAGSGELSVRLVDAFKGLGGTTPEETAIYECSAGGLLLAAGDAQGAADRFRRAAGADPGSIVPLVFLESLAYDSKDNGRYLEVAGTLAPMLEKPELKADLLCRIGLVKGELGRAAEGAQDIAEALRLSPENEVIFDHLVSVMEGEGRWDALTAILDEVAPRIESPARTADFFGVLGSLQWKRLGDHARAVKSFNRVLKHDPFNVPALLGLLDIYTSRDQRDEALAISRHILGEITDLGAIRVATFTMADLAQKGKVEAGEALEAFESLARRSADDADVVLAFAGLLGKAGQKERAAGQLEAFLSSAGERAGEEAAKKVRAALDELKG